MNELPTSDLPSNPAARVYTLLDKVNRQSATSSALDAWAEVLGTSERREQEKETETATLLADIKGEIEEAVRLLRQQGYSEEVMRRPVRRAHAVTSLRHLAGKWGPLKEKLGEDTLNLWRMLAENIGDEDWRIPTEELQSISKLLSELRNLIAQGELDQNLLEFITMQLDLIERALRRYSVRGPKVLPEVIAQAMLIWAEYDSVDLASNEEARNLLEDIWHHIITWANRVRAVDTLTKAGGALLQLGSGG